ncbi:MAG: hypothetical protein WD904_04725 [Dehalococcoidia bacterium]
MADMNPATCVRLDFEVDPEMLEESRGLHPAARDYGDLMQILFAMPITLQVDGVVLLERLHRPIAYVAAEGVEQLKDFRAPSACTCYSHLAGACHSNFAGTTL